MATTQIRWGVLGAARIATTRMIPAIHMAQNSRLTAIASRDKNRANQLAQDYALENAFSDYDALLASDAIDVVYIPLPTGMHTEWVLKALAAQKHVLCEKPMGMSSSDIDQIIDAQKSTGLVVGEAFMVAQHPQWKKVRDLIENGAIGCLRYVEGSFSYFNNNPDSYKNKPELGGGGLRDIGVYPLLCTRLATGRDPLRAKATIDWDPDFKIDRFARCELDFDGFTLDFYCATQLSRRQCMTFHGEKGWIRVPVPFNAQEWGAARVEVCQGDPTWLEIFEWPSENQYALQVENFASSVLGGTSFTMSLENSRTNQSIIDALFESDNLGQQVSL
ncbi:MAG: Gfo/Idh/MocA family oxidoreductase [Pseudohongiellaceae bacterium]